MAGTGRRAYDGQNNRGEPLRTESHLRTYGVRTELWLQPGQLLGGTGRPEPIRPGPHNHGPRPDRTELAGWSLGLALEHRRIHREIASAGLTLGYPERFDVRTASVGLRYQGNTGQWGTPGVELWWGGGPAGRMHLHLPGAQPALLRLGEQQHLRASALWAFPRGWPAGEPGHWQANLRFIHSHDRWGQGPASTIWRSGNPSGGAAQPQTALRENTLMLEVRRDWP
jgi:hypothetical protein